MKNLIIICSVIAVFAINSTLARLPPGLKGCDRNLDQAEYNLCWVQFGYNFRQYLTEEIEDLDLPRFDPFDLYRLGFVRKTQYLDLDGYTENLHIVGISKYYFEKFHFDKHSLSFTASFVFPRLEVGSNFHVDGKLFGITIPTRGRYDANFTNTRIEGTGRFATYLDDKGVKRMRMVSTSTSFGLGPGPLVITAPPTHQWAANVVMYIYRAARPLVLNILNPILADLTNEVVKILWTRILSHIRFDELFLDSLAPQPQYPTIESDHSFQNAPDGRPHKDITPLGPINIIL